MAKSSSSRSTSTRSKREKKDGFVGKDELAALVREEVRAAMREFIATSAQPLQPLDVSQPANSAAPALGDNASDSSVDELSDTLDDSGVLDIQVDAAPANYVPPVAVPPSDVVTEPGTGIQTVVDQQLLEFLTKESFAVLEPQRQHAEEILDRYREALQNWPRVTGLDIDLRSRDGAVRLPLEYVIQVFVSKKLPEDHPDIGPTLPKEIEGVRVNVIEEQFQTADSEAGFHRFLHPQIVGGISITSVDDERGWGTLGLRVRWGNERVFLTNEHVVGGSSGTFVRQPDSGNTANSIFGTVAAAARTDFIDCALVRPFSTGRPHRGGVIVEPATPGSAPNFFSGQFEQGFAQKNDNVFKIGAASGSRPIALGKIESVSRQATIVDTKGRKHSFFNQIVVKPHPNSPAGTLIQPGDSGSVLLKQVIRSGKRVNKVVGLVHGQASSGSLKLIACPIQAILAKFGTLQFE